MVGVADIAVPAALLAEPARARIMFALADGRALAASVLAVEADVAASTASEHLSRLLDAGMVIVEPQGRHRYYRIASADVVRVLEALALIAPEQPVRSLREGTRAHAVRRARLCYDHLGGKLAVALMQALIERRLIEGGDGMHDPTRAVNDRLSAPGQDIDYRLTGNGERVLGDFGVSFDRLRARRRPLIRYCLDWSEQRHHLAGAIGGAIAERMLELEWLSRAPRSRAVLLTKHGERSIRETFGVTLAE
jgi:DNA-binding transcriptional ArsR family regulator